MGVLVGREDRVIVQGITGRTGRVAAQRMLADGTPLVGGVAPGRAGAEVEGVPVFDTVYQAVAEAGATASLISVPAAGAADAAIEAIDAGLRTVVIYAEHVPLHDALRIRAFTRGRPTVVLGPNSAGCVTPGAANLSDLNAARLRPGAVGIVSKSGTLTYEVLDSLAALGHGASSVVCLGGDPVLATDHAAILRRLEADEDTRVAVLIGEIGGRSEIAAAEVVATMRTPVVAFIAGHHAPPGKRMGHAGALLADPDETAPAKSALLAAAGATVVRTIVEVGPAAVARLAGAP